MNNIYNQLNDFEKKYPQKDYERKEFPFTREEIARLMSLDTTIQMGEIARKMVTTWGLSNLGPLTFGDEEEEVFIGRTMNKHKEMSDRTAQQIDEEVRAIIDRNYQRAKEILVARMDILHLMAESLIKYETIDSNQLNEIMSGKEPTPPEDWGSPKPLDKTEVVNEAPAKQINGQSIENPAEGH